MNCVFELDLLKKLIVVCNYKEKICLLIMASVTYGNCYLWQVLLISTVLWQV